MFLMSQVPLILTRLVFVQFTFNFISAFYSDMLNLTSDMYLWNFFKDSLYYAFLVAHKVDILR